LALLLITKDIRCLRHMTQICLEMTHTAQNPCTIIIITITNI